MTWTLEIAGRFGLMGALFFRGIRSFTAAKPIVKILLKAMLNFLI